MNNLEKLINDAKEEFNEAWHEPDVYQPKLESFDDWLTQKLTQAYNQGKEYSKKETWKIVNLRIKYDKNHNVPDNEIIQGIIDASELKI